MNSVTRRTQAALLLMATVAWWEQNTPQGEDDDESCRGINGATVLDQYAYQKRVGFSDVTYLIARGALACTNGEYRQEGGPLRHLRDAARYLKDANQA